MLQLHCTKWYSFRLNFTYPAIRIDSSHVNSCLKPKLRWLIRIFVVTLDYKRVNPALVCSLWGLTVRDKKGIYTCRMSIHDLGCMGYSSIFNIGYIGMCRPKEYASLDVLVWKWVKSFSHFGLKLCRVSKRTMRAFYFHQAFHLQMKKRERLPFNMIKCDLPHTCTMHVKWKPAHGKTGSMVFRGQVWKRVWKMT